MDDFRKGTEPLMLNKLRRAVHNLRPSARRLGVCATSSVAREHSHAPRAEVQCITPYIFNVPFWRVLLDASLLWTVLRSLRIREGSRRERLVLEKQVLVEAPKVLSG